MSDPVRICFPVSPFRTLVSEENETRMIFDSDLLDLMKKVQCTARALRFAGLELGSPVFDDGERFHFEAQHIVQSNAVPRGASEVVTEGLHSLRAEASRSNEGREPAQKESEVSSNDMPDSDTEAKNKRNRRLVSLLKNCPSIIQVNDKKVPLGMPETRAPLVVKRSKEVALFSSVGEEEYAVCRDDHRIRAIEPGALSRLNVGQSITVFGARRVTERILELNDEDRQMRLGLERRPPSFE